MTEREVIIVLEDDFGRVQTTMKTELSPPQLMDKIFELKEENEQLRHDATILIQANQEYRQTIKELERKLRITSAHLLSDECALTDGQLRKIMKELDGEKE